MKYVLVITDSRGIEIDFFETEERARDAFMRDLYEWGQDYDLPDEYDAKKINAFLDAAHVTDFDWRIARIPD